MTFDLIPIGEVRSPVSDRRLMPPEGVPAAIEVYPEFADGLLLIEENTHLWVIGWLEEADRTRLQIVRAAYEPARRRRGVFGLRSAARPNSLSLSATRLVAVEGTTLRVDSLDLVDGTPVVDLKRYSPSWDCIFSARATATCSTGPTRRARASWSTRRRTSTASAARGSSPPHGWSSSSRSAGTSCRKMTACA